MSLQAGVAMAVLSAKLPSIEALLRNGDVLANSGFDSLHEALEGMGEIYGDDPYPAIGIFLDVGEWRDAVSACRSMGKSVYDSMRSTSVMRDYFMDGMK